MDILQQLKAKSRVSGGTRRVWSYDEIVLLLEMKAAGKKAEDIAIAVNHPKHSLTYKFNWAKKFTSLEEIRAKFQSGDVEATTDLGSEEVA